LFKKLNAYEIRAFRMHYYVKTDNFIKFQSYLNKIHMQIYAI